MQHLEVSGVVRPIYGSLGVKRLRKLKQSYNLLMLQDIHSIVSLSTAAGTGYLAGCRLFMRRNCSAGGRDKKDIFISRILFTKLSIYALLFC